MLACGPLALPTPTIAPLPPSSTPTAPVSATPVLPSSTPAQPPSPTLPAATLTAELPTPAAEVSATPAVPQPAAPAHFRTGDPVQLDSIAMKSRTEGWGLSGAYVLATADGGQTWREATPPESFPSAAQNQAYGAFLDAQTAWIVFAEDSLIPPEASVWRTTDGGRTWTPSPPLSHQVVGEKVWAEFAVLDAQNVWMMVRGVYAGAGTHFNHELFHTADGGLTWTSLDGQISDDYTGMVFTDANFGLRTLQTTGFYAPGPPAYDVTTDAGADWENRELPPPPEAPDLFNQYPYCETFQPVLLSAQSIRLLVGCFDEYEPPKQFTSYFYSSQDGGATWQTVHLPAKVQAAQDQLIYFDFEPSPAAWPRHLPERFGRANLVLRENGLLGRAVFIYRRPVWLGGCPLERAGRPPADPRWGRHLDYAQAGYQTVRRNKMTAQICPINLGFVNSYLVKTGDGFILVDTGIRGSRPALEKALQNAGCQPGNLKLVILTHGDVDHTSNAAYLGQKYKASIAMHRNDASMVENGEMGPKRKVKSLFLRAMHVVMRISGGNGKMMAGFDKFKPDVYLEEGQSLKEYGFDATVLHLPGHTQGSIALLAADGALICGDTLENRGRPQPAGIVDDEAELAASLARLSKLTITTVYPGHGKPFAWEQLSH